MSESKPTVRPKDGNAYSILGATRKALRRSGMSDAKVDRIMAEAMAGDYDHLIQTCMEHVELEVSE